MNDRQFDQQLRQQWQNAAAHLPGHVRLQLSPAIAAQSRANTPARNRWLPWAASLASLAVLAVLLMPLWHTPQHPPTQTAQQLGADEAIDSDDGLLSVNPDFYAWLDSDEVRTLAAN
ncbi:MAG: hypothetical protein Q4B94_07680 [Pseudomonadota bacterium]|nr:hypothetical protein [Pseudomonadota bacterium]